MYFLFISVRSPPLACVYDILCCIHLVIVCVLLKIILYCGNRFCIYFVDFVAVILVSCIFIIAGLFGVFDRSLWRFGRAVFRDDAFHVIMCVLRLVVWFIWGLIIGMLGIGEGWEYSCIGYVYFNDSVSNFSGKKRNLSVISCMVSGSLLCLMKVYSSLWIVLGGLIMSWFVCKNFVYGCVFVMCLSGGF